MRWRGLGRDEIGDGSSLFNMMRNLGGAIGISLIDTVMFTRGPGACRGSYRESSRPAIRQTLDLLGLTQADIAGGLDPMRLLDLMPDLEKQSLVMAINDAWTMLTAVTLIALVALLFTRKPDRPSADLPPRH